MTELLDIKPIINALMDRIMGEAVFADAVNTSDGAAGIYFGKANQREPLPHLRVRVLAMNPVGNTTATGLYRPTIQIDAVTDVETLAMGLGISLEGFLRIPEKGETIVAGGWEIRGMVGEAVNEALEATYTDDTTFYQCPVVFQCEIRRTV